MHTLGDMANAVNRFPVHLSKLQKQFALPPMVANEYSVTYLASLRTIISLRSLNISEYATLDPWLLKKKLLQLIHAGPTSSTTWFQDECGRTAHAHRRLVLTNYHLGMGLDAEGIQPGLSFHQRPRELFAGTEMGGDAMGLQRACMMADMAAKIPASSPRSDGLRRPCAPKSVT